MTELCVDVINMMTSVYKVMATVLAVTCFALGLWIGKASERFLDG